MENITVVLLSPDKPPSITEPPPVPEVREPKPEPITLRPRVPETLSLPQRLLSAGLAGCIADAITFPLDTAKVRLQIQGERAGSVHYSGIGGTLYTLAKTEGIKSWYNGLAAGLQRQMAFASIRIGLYENVKELYKANIDAPNIVLRIMAGLTTGAMAVSCAQPTDVVKVRLQAQSNTKYKNTLHAYTTIGREEGVRGLWKGATPNIARNSIVNVTELVSYDTIKDTLIHHGLCSDNLPCHMFCGFGAGLITTIIASPVDVIKTRFMNSTVGTYTGVFNCARTMFVKEGPAAFYKGFMPAFVRFGSWNILMFVCYEQIKPLMLRLSALNTNNHNVAGM